MRYRLRTLLIVLALGPPMIAGGWWKYSSWRAEQERKEIIRGERVSSQAFPIMDSYSHGEALVPKPTTLDLP